MRAHEVARGGPQADYNGGVLLNGEKVTDEFREVAEQDFADGELMIKKGKRYSIV